MQTSKTLNYLDSIVIGPYFGFFIGVWVYCRHYLNLRILWAVLTTFRTIGPYELNWETQQYKCWISQIITFSLLAALQAVNMFWFYFIARIAVNYMGKGDRRDQRSDDEDEDDLVEDEGKGKANGKIAAPEEPGVKLLVNGKPVGEVRHENGKVTASGKKEGKKQR